MSSSDDGRDTPGGDTAVDPNARLPALFWDTLPDRAEDHPDYQALQALADESTPEERAESFKAQGNNKLRIGLQAQNRLLLREAADFYSKGLALACGDARLNVALLNNRAHVNSLLGNWRSALRDSHAALELDARNVKASFRGARAALRLGEWDACEQLVAAGLQLDPGAAELLQVQQELASSRKQHQDQQAAQAAAREAAFAPARQLAAALSLKGYRLAAPQVELASKKPYLDPRDGSLHWPVLLLFPETGQQDVVEDWHEADTVAAQLDVMFGPGAPPLPWDAGGEYSRGRVRLYYLSHAGSPLAQDELAAALHGTWPDSEPDPALRRYGPTAARWVAVDEACSLRQVLLAPDHVVPGIPLFWVLAEGSSYQARFLAEELQRF